MTQLVQTLYEAPELPRYELGDKLERLYDGGLGFAPPKLFVNFVTSVDGVAGVRSERSSPSLISRSSPADRFVMGLLRACAGCVLIGAGTLRDEPQHRWTPEHVFPQAAPDFAELRQRLGLAPQPELVVVTTSGELDASLASLRGALIVTSAPVQKKLNNLALPASEIMSVSDDSHVDLETVLARLRERGHELVLCEGGPRLMGQLVRDALVDELFLTVSPLLLGRLDLLERPALMAGVELPADAAQGLELLSVRRSDSHLLLRYAFVQESPI
jgi:riboflavin biosynthesis pyrimidine reductase